MRVIILSAGQGRRLLPLTASNPKCLIPVQGDRCMLDFQLRALAETGIRRVTVMVGFRAARVERLLARYRDEALELRTRFNPFYAVSDNLVTAWLASCEMDGDFALLNGDTLFEPALAERLFRQTSAPVTVAVDRKSSYDQDDMKVELRGEDRLIAIGKTLDAAETSAESIGLMVFRGAGVAAFREALEAAIRRPGALRAWYPSAIQELAGKLAVKAVSIHGSWWAEVDSQEDLARARAEIAKRWEEPEVERQQPRIPRVSHTRAATCSASRSGTA